MDSFSDISEEQWKVIEAHFTRTVKQHKDNIFHYEKLENEHTQLDRVLVKLLDKTRHKCMIPIVDSNLAFMPGEIYDTNNILVLLGENYFAEQSVNQARRILHRRKKVLRENLEKEKKLLSNVYQKMGLTKYFANLEDEYKRQDVMDIKEEYNEEHLKKNIPKNIPKKFKSKEEEKANEEEIEKMFEELELEERMEEESILKKPHHEDIEKEFEEYFGSKKEEKHVTFKEEPIIREKTILPKKENTGFTGIILERDPNTNIQQKEEPKKKRVSRFKQMRQGT